MRKISKGHNSAKIVAGVTVYFLCTPFVVDYNCTKFHENILDSIRVRVADKIFIS